MRYISLFSGIEAASVAWEPLGFEAVAFSEVDPFCNEVLSTRFPNVQNLGDISQIDWGPYYGKVDIVVGGSPCQAFSVAGKRAGLLDDRGALMLEYVRAVREVEPSWCLWENVPGVLSQDGGRAFATLQRELEDCGYSLAWRVLDAQFFGVAQRRRRVFLIGHSRAECAAAVLFERESLCRNHPKSGDKRKELAAQAKNGTRNANALDAVHQEGILDLYEHHRADARVKGPLEVCPTVTAHYGTGGVNTPIVHGSSCPSDVFSIVGNVIGRKPENGGNGNGFQPADEPMYTLTATDVHAVARSYLEHAKDKQQPLLVLNDYGGSWMNISYDLAPTLRANMKGHEPIVMGSAQSNAAIMEGLCPTQCARQYKDPPVLFQERCKEAEIAKIDARGFAQNTRNELHYIGGDGEVAGALAAQPGMKQQTFLESSVGVRRLTPVECERLQGFPDDWTLIKWKTKPEEECPDSHRYKAIGNSMAVPVMRWIGERIQAVDRLYESKKSSSFKAS